LTSFLTTLLVFIQQETLFLGEGALNGASIIQ